MEVKYVLKKKDFLTFQLFNATQSEHLRKVRKRNLFILPTIFILLSLFFVSKGDLTIVGIYLSIAIAWFIFYPGYSRKRYKAYYEKYIVENYHNRFDREVTLGLEDDYLYAKDHASESKTKITEIAEAYETADHLYIKFLTGHTHIVPKQRVDNFQSFRKTLKVLSQKLDIEYIDDPNWKWS
ncbi:MAG: hypothetical protein AAF502_08995 [Bacteroidota bacterium]